MTDDETQVAIDLAVEGDEQLLREALEALNGIQAVVTLNHRLTVEPTGILDIGAFWEKYPAVIRVMAKLNDRLLRE